MQNPILKYTYTYDIIISEGGEHHEQAKEKAPQKSGAARQDAKPSSRHPSGRDLRPDNSGNPQIARLVKDQRVRGLNPRTPTIKDFNENVKGVNMKYLLFVIIFVPVFLLVRWAIRKLWK